MYSDIIENTAAVIINDMNMAVTIDMIEATPFKSSLYTAMDTIAHTASSANVTSLFDICFVRFAILDNVKPSYDRLFYISLMRCKRMEVKALTLKWTNLCHEGI